MKKSGAISMDMILLLVIGVAVAVLVIWGFYTGWGQGQNTITDIMGGGENLGSVGKSCKTACASMSDTTFCNEIRTVSGLSKDQVSKVGKLNDDVITPPTTTTTTTTGSKIAGEKSFTPTAVGYKGVSAKWTKDGWILGGITCSQLESAKLIIVDGCSVACPSDV